MDEFAETFHVVWRTYTDTITSSRTWTNNRGQALDVRYLLIGGGGGGGYLIGCNIRGNGGPGFMGITSFGSGTYPAKQMTFGDAVGLGGAGGAQTWNYTPKPGSLGGGIWNEVAGPGSGVVVVTW